LITFALDAPENSSHLGFDSRSSLLATVLKALELAGEICVSGCQYM
jgi:hypothetical protein